MKRATISADGETIVVHIPMSFRKRGGRKLVVTPDGAEWAPRPRVDNAMVKGLARAFRWRKMLDEGVYATLEDVARAKGVHATYVSRVLRMTLLAPEIVEAILDGRQPAELQLDDLLDGFPVEWDSPTIWQAARLGSRCFFWARRPPQCINTARASAPAPKSARRAARGSLPR